MGARCRSMCICLKWPVWSSSSSCIAHHVSPFEGELGWRGLQQQAPPAQSPRRTPDGEKTSLVESSSKCLKLRHNFIEIDLNVAGRAVMPLLIWYLYHFGIIWPTFKGSSMEISSKRAEMFKLDPNCI